MATMKKAEGDVASELDDAILEMARDARGTGTMSDAVFEKITRRQIGPIALARPNPITGPEILGLREKANMSQAVFARWLNVTPGYVSQLERGIRRPSGPALVLLNVIRRHGMELVVEGDGPRSVG